MAIVAKILARLKFSFMIGTQPAMLDVSTCARILKDETTASNSYATLFLR
jgi:hypothetical protein